MTTLPAAKQSPRVDAGVLRWYAGDTFRLLLQLEVVDQDGAVVMLGEDDTLTVEFFDQTQKPVYTASPTLTASQAELVFDEALSAKFTKGTYSYDICCTHGDNLTLVRQNRVIVE